MSKPQELGVLQSLFDAWKKNRNGCSKIDPKYREHTAATLREIADTIEKHPERVLSFMSYVLAVPDGKDELSENRLFFGHTTALFYSVIVLSEALMKNHDTKEVLDIMDRFAGELNAKTIH